MIRQGKNGASAPRLKICGLTRAADVAHCVRRGVHYVGFNFYPGSKRFIEPAAARALWTGLAERGATKAVAVVVDPDPEGLARALALFPELHAVQFHGAESPEALAILAQSLGGRAAWKALGVAAPADVAARPRLYQGRCELVLLDNAKVPAGAKVMGGSGQVFDWRWLSAYDAAPALGVAGGVTPQNAADLLAYPRVALVDVSSGVETAPGVKDPAAIDALARIMAL